MCDSIVVVHENRVLFGKNSDRDPNEGQNLVWTPARTNAPDARLRCTYIDIPDIPKTYATLTSQPFWMWGAEIGTNEKGVTIGNEAVFTKTPYEEEPGLIGMDLLRLALERSATAQEALQTITDLLRQHGQGGGCGHEDRTFTYHNSYLIADPQEAYILETAARDYAAEAIHGARTISNGLTIPRFAEKHTDYIKTKGSGCHTRRARTQALADQAINTQDIIHLLQDHGEKYQHPHYAMINGGLHAPCVHAGGLAANSQTTASWVTELRPDTDPAQQLHWVTATAAPCTSIYKPIRVDTPLQLEHAQDTLNNSLWWQHETFHRTILKNPKNLLTQYQQERDLIQTQWLHDPPTPQQAFDQAHLLLTHWTQHLKNHPQKDTRPLHTKQYWKKRNQRAGLEA